MAGPQAPLDSLAEHLASVRRAAEDNEFVDVAEAERLHGLLTDALRDWARLDGEQRRILGHAVAYFVRTDDEENDLRSPIGFDDDAEVIEAALEQITPR